MIIVKVDSEFGSYHKFVNQGFDVHSAYHHIDSYAEPINAKDWSACPCCKLKPKVWIFDNGRSTACGCWNSRYEIFSVKAESIMSVYKRTGMTAEYDADALRINWNEYCATEINPCNHTDLLLESKW